MTLSDILNIIVALVGLTLSVIAICISIGTFRTQTRMSLFEKRYDIYYACELICGLCSIGQPNNIIPVLEIRDVKCADKYIGAAQFLFNKETSEFVSEVFSKWYLMRDLYDVLEDDAKVNTLDVKAEFEQLIIWFTMSKQKLDKIFCKYFDLRELK